MGLYKGNPFLFDGLFDDEGGVVDGAHRGVFFMGLCQNACHTPSPFGVLPLRLRGEFDRGGGCEADGGV